MANAAAKKAVKAGSSASLKYLQFIVASTLLFVGARFFYFGPTFSDVVYLLIFSGIYTVCYFGLVESAQNKVHSEIYFDMFVVVFLSEVVSAFSNWGRALLLLIPAYFTYLGVNWYLGTKKVAPAPVEDSGASKNSKQSEKNTSRKSKTRSGTSR